MCPCVQTHGRNARVAFCPSRHIGRVRGVPVTPTPILSNGTIRPKTPPSRPFVTKGARAWRPYDDRPFNLFVLTLSQMPRTTTPIESPLKPVREATAAAVDDMSYRVASTPT
jgi:hypothetical protein